MLKNNPIKRADIIQEEFRNYLSSTLAIGDKDLNYKFLTELKKTPLFKGPYLSVALPFKTEKTINDYINERLLSSEFSKLKEIDKKQKLYSHQYKAIKSIKNKRSIVVTTGTGSGKTESFLYPILNDILEDIENGREHKGIRAIFLYPVNALVNDQIERLRNILKDYLEITYGSYTGETPENEEKLMILDKIDKQRTQAIGREFIEPPRNEIRHRDAMRENPPHLLFTNYAMLEYILLRPNDQRIFIDANTKNWKFIVLDEAHRYQGALGIEMSNLLKRLSGKYQHQALQYILTSATLGKGKDDIDAIINFAHSLTSASYLPEDVLFAERLNYTLQPTIKIEPNEYSKIIENLENTSYLAGIAKKYDVPMNENIHEFIYDLLIKDKILYEIIDHAKKHKAINFYEIFESLHQSFDVSMKDFINYIELISLSSKEARSLLTIKYHIFIRTPQGAFAVIKPQAKLKLSRVKDIDDQKAYEIGVCKFCSSMYYIGNINNQANKFIQNDKADLYENYGEDLEAIERIDFLLIDEDSNNELSEKENIQKYELCNKCGHLRLISNINGKNCECDSNNKLHVHHIVQDKSSLKNNVKQCPICESSHRAGIVRAFHIQKDEATALLSQINLKSMYEDYETVPQNDKQFIAFSDSVQQASYFATFLEHNHMRFLRKRLILEMFKKLESNKLSFRELTGELEEYIKEKKLIFVDENIDEAYLTEAWVTTLTELLKVDGQFSGEGLGLYAFYLKNITERKVQKVLESNTFMILNKLNYDDLKAILHIALDIFRTTPAINYKKHELNKETLNDELDYRSYENFVVLRNILSKSEKEFNNVRSFLPSSTKFYTGKHNKLTNFLEKVLKKAYMGQEQKVDHDLVVELAQEIWDLADKLEIFEANSLQPEQKRINVSSYEIHEGVGVDWYQCKKCLKTTPHNALSTCPQQQCDGKLIPFDFGTKKLDIGNFYRQQYLTKTIERIIVEEHTAQVGKKIGRTNQELFKNQKINVLSSSTTFEMGIDIGSLDNVFMRNVPPTPANYAQRAGRAGRRNGNAGFVMTYCGVSSHDYTYFNHPEEMIEGIIKPPYFKTNNSKIIIRHIAAAALGFFFENTDSFSQTIGQFLYEGGIDEFINYVKSKPSNLNEYINQSLLENQYLDSLKDFGWIEDVTGEESALLKMKHFVISEVNQLKHAKAEADKLQTSKASEQAKYYQAQIERIKDEHLIEKLSRAIVIPKYGFPVDVVELEIIRRGRTDNNFEPTRDLSIAISEYAPESEIIVNKKKYKSRYIQFPYRDFDKLVTKFYYECSGCNKITSDYDFTSEKMMTCSACGNKHHSYQKYLIPAYGFATEDKSITSGMLKPKKTYASETKYLGGGKSNNDRTSIHASISVESAKDDELMSINTNPFFVCKTCGYTKIDRKKGGLPHFNEEHESKFGKGSKCSSKNLEKYHLAHTFKTDVIKITLSDKLDMSESLSLLYSLLDGISLAFNIERRDISGVINNDNSKTQFIIFDQVPGGAGHVKRLMSRTAILEMIEEAFRIVNQECCDEDTSCYNCLRNYGNQAVHEKLKRGSAMKILKSILERLKDIKPVVKETEEDVIINQDSVSIKNQGVRLNLTDLVDIVLYAIEDYGFTQEEIEQITKNLMKKHQLTAHDVFYQTKININNEVVTLLLYWADSKIIIFDDEVVDSNSLKTHLSNNWRIISIRDLRK